MKNQYSDDRFLAKWLNNDLDEQEQMRFEQSEEFEKYQKIVNSLDKLSPPAYDKQNLLRTIQKNIEKKQKTKTIKLIPNWVYGVAASLLVLLGIFYYVNLPVKYTTGYGEQISLVLPDGSEVMLNSQSEISYKKSGWENKRDVYLSGEAFFKVQKGSKFRVSASSGTVEVLGTRFNVNTHKDFFEVICTEGKVKTITQNKEESILTKGNALRSIKGQIEKWDANIDTPGWMRGETSFTNTPIKNVIISLENQFNITFEKRKIDEGERFTGSYSHSNMELALKTIFVPMEISYTFKNENTIVLVKE